MLGSINPLGERARGSRWGVTVGFFAVAAIAAGGAGGAALGWFGSVTLDGTEITARLVAFAVIVLFGTALDLRVAGARLPTIRRQVNEDWLGRYRGWVVGAGFGAQLGVGVATIVTTSAVYAPIAAAGLARPAPPRRPVGLGVRGGPAAPAGGA